MKAKPRVSSAKYFHSVSRPFPPATWLAVHRFGSLGAKNAIELGLDKHSSFLENSRKLDQQALEKIALILTAVAKTINSYLFRSLIERTAENKAEKTSEAPYSRSWFWGYRKDKTRFLSYYKIYALTSDSAASPRAIELYKESRTQLN